MTSDAETNIDWSIQLAMIRLRFEAALRAGETFDGLDVWLRQVPENVREQLREELEICRDKAHPESVETRVLSSDAAIGQAVPDDLFSTDKLTSENAVRGCRTFQGLSSDAMAALETELQPKSFPSGTLLLLQGEMARGLYLILSGSVDIIDTATGERIDCDGAGSVLGEMSLLTGQPCSAQVVATSDVHALFLSADGYRRLTDQHPELEIALSQLVSDRLGGRKHDALCGKVIGDYVLDRCLNRGGMGVVYEAHHATTGKSVALKMLRHCFIYDDQMKGRFDQEADLLGNLEHPNVISIRHHFLAYRTRFLVLDLCDGADLFHVLMARGPLDEPTARAILGQIARGLLYAHESGVIHRDLKPGNVLVDRQGQVKLTDFGLSKLIKSEVKEGKAVGTPAYMPPEQFRNDNAGPACDWYALGCLACELLTGEILFDGRNWMELFNRKRKQFPSADWPDIDASEELKRIIRDSLQPKVGQRRMNLTLISSWARPVDGLFD